MQREDDLKRKLRRLKHLELKLRFPDNPTNSDRLLWGRFFSDRPEVKCKYPFQLLLDNDQRRKAFADFIITLYYQYYRERGLLDTSDPLALAGLGLPPDASLQEIKARFRDLVKKYHPDVGGEHSQMVELIKQYRQLTREKE